MQSQLYLALIFYTEQRIGRKNLTIAVSLEKGQQEFTFCRIKSYIQISCEVIKYSNIL
jgi:hypothetical protein